MAISVKKTIYDVERKYNALNSGKAKDFSVLDIVSFINDATEIIVEHLVFEEDQNRAIRNHLKDLIRKPKKPAKHNIINEECCVVELPEDHYATSNMYVIAKHSCCVDPVTNEPILKRIPVITTQSDDLHPARSNPYRKSNFLFEQLIGDEAHDGFYLYTDCQMEIVDVYIEYIKKFKRVEAPSLTGCDKNQYENYCRELITQDCDFELCSTFINRKVTDIAVYLMSTASRDLSFSQAKISEIINLNNVHR